MLSTLQQTDVLLHHYGLREALFVSCGQTGTPEKPFYFSYLALARPDQVLGIRRVQLPRAPARGVMAALAKAKTWLSGPSGLPDGVLAAAQSLLEEVPDKLCPMPVVFIGLAVRSLEQAFVEELREATPQWRFFAVNVDETDEARKRATVVAAMRKCRSIFSLQGKVLQRELVYSE